MTPPGKISKTRVPLRGFERVFSMADNGSLKIVHVMAIRGSEGAIGALLKSLPQALVHTFNRHPRMRITQVKGEFAMGEIQPQITLDTVSKKKLLEIREIHDEASASWDKYVEDEWQIPFERYSEMPHYVRVWHYPGQSLARVLLFSDHYLSDGISGMAVLNDIVTFASELSRESPASDKLAVSDSEELPLRPSLYEMWMRPKPWSLFVGKVLVKLFGKMLYVGEMKRFHPIVPIRADHADLMVPIKINPCSALFAQGTTENMKMALKRCRDEGVTLFGALAAATVVSYYINCDDDKRNEGSPFKLALELPLNMRNRVPNPAPEVQVGAYMTSCELESFSKDGVAMDSVTFWDLARKSKRELEELLESFVMPLSLLFLDKYVNSNLTQEFLNGVHVRHSAVADIDISNIGRYPHKTVHTFQTANQGLEALTIDSVHVANSIPHAGPAATIYVSSIDKLSYGFMHKYDDTRGKKVFETLVASIERIGQIASKETMLDVVNAVQQAQS
ncbi:Abc transporter b family member 25 [Globisporangium polare]